jgi:hypothetical protein
MKDKNYDALEQVAAIREILWPNGDPEHSWSPDTLDAIAAIVGPPPEREDDFAIPA